MLHIFIGNKFLNHDCYINNYENSTASRILLKEFYGKEDLSGNGNAP